MRRNAECQMRNAEGSEPSASGGSTSGADAMRDPTALRLRRIAVLIAATLFVCGSPPRARAQPYEVTWYTIDGGGEMYSTGGDYQVGGTIGQCDAGTMSGGDYTVRGGFWVMRAAEPPPGGAPEPERGGPDCQAGVKFCHDLAGGGSATSCSTDADCGGGEFCWDDCWGDWRGASCVVYDHVTGAARCYIPKNRYLTIDPTVNDAPMAYHLTLTELDDQYNPACVGTQGWLGDPVCRADDTGCPVEPQPAPTDPCQGGGQFGWVSYVVPGPVMPRTWNEYPLFVAGREVAPAASYELRGSADGITPAEPPLIIMTSHDPNGPAQHWGDVTSDPGTSIPWKPPEFATSFSDVSAAIKTFEGAGGPALEWSDIEIDHVVSFGDIGFVIKAFEGDTYPGLADITGGCPTDPEFPRPLIGHEPCP